MLPPERTGIAGTPNVSVYCHICCLVSNTVNGLRILDHRDVVTFTVTPAGVITYKVFE
jgi:hypothetical protein